MNDDKLIMVCSACKTASCWYGEFMCSLSRQSDTELKTIKELKELKLESFDNWSNKKLIEIYNDPNPFGYKEERISRYKEINNEQT